MVALNACGAAGVDTGVGVAVGVGLGGTVALGVDVAVAVGVAVAVALAVAVGVAVAVAVAVGVGAGVPVGSLKAYTHCAGHGIERVNVIGFCDGNNHRPIGAALDVERLRVNIAGNRAIKVEVTRQRQA